MLERINSAIKTGIKKIKWYSYLIAERIKIEIAVIKLMGRSEKYESERRKLLTSIGERIYDLKNKQGINVYEDGAIRDLLKRLDQLEEEISRLRKEAEEISALEV
ncbi:hypothetical protein BMS3Abin07_01791 [bacterium BMS3Abin07]|nr:hypothetical protein BMS3Abin07_01791 [bacterium BMS3Abin07]GBE31967.1 hypothetical protein BMS3Bbin05_00872 [bacterium BMS3Bbin05]HDL20180.1 hypothetical protein [Nitrospirota bacterium]HDO21468.1 hypothetical protein [Nitrospirota bacterium]HDZ87803.1 hypothetical protein [Nitrospirota bacterium]